MKDANIQFNSDGLPPLRAIDKLPYLNAVINEALRVYPAIPMSEPRVLLDPSKQVRIYGHNIPAGTICSMQPYTENRIPEYFPDPDRFNPERWMIPRDSEQYKAMNRRMWSFSSGGRMCLGVQYFPSGVIETDLVLRWRRCRWLLQRFMRNMTRGFRQRQRIRVWKLLIRLRVLDLRYVASARNDN